MSLRSQEIEAEKKRRGVQGAEADERVNKALRKGKEEWDATELRAQWLAAAREMGQDVEAVRRAADQRRLDMMQLTSQQCTTLADAAIEYAMDVLMEHQSVVDRYEVMAQAMEYALSTPGVRSGDVQAAFDRRIQLTKPGHGSIVEVDHYRIGRPGARYTTSVMRAAEQEIMDIALRGRGQSLPVSTLRKEQWAEFKALYRERQSSDGRMIPAQR